MHCGGSSGKKSKSAAHWLPPMAADCVESSAIANPPAPHPPCAVNVVQHTYFNLSGHNQGNILDHVATIK